MINKIKKIFGLKGSWKWAIKQMKKGKIIRDTLDTGSRIMKIDNKINQRIVWDFRYLSEKLNDNTPKWESANIFLSDLESVTYEIVKEFK